MITDFISTKLSKEELKTTLKVLREFKDNESMDEYINIMFSSWVKLEQLEELLEHLVEGEPLKDDTIKYMKH